MPRGEESAAARGPHHPIIGLACDPATGGAELDAQIAVSVDGILLARFVVRIVELTAEVRVSPR